MDHKAHIHFLTILMQNCEDGESKMKEIFSLLYEHLQTREKDLWHELEGIRQTAGKRQQVPL